MRNKVGLSIFRWEWRILLALLLLSVFAASPALGAQTEQERRIEFQGSIGYGERMVAPLPPEVVAHVWMFEGAEGDEIAIAMNALTEELDPYLLLLEMSDADLEEFFALSDEEMEELPAAAEERGLIRDLNDDRAEDTNALIPFYVLPASGRYYIVATSCCTGSSSGRYELILDVMGRQEPGDPDPLAPELRSFAPREGRAGSELIVSLEGAGLSELGSPLGVAIDGLEIQILDFVLVNDRRLDMAIFIPEETPLGEREISFFFENAGFDGPFVVFEPQEPPEPGESPFVPQDEDPDPTIPPPEPRFPIIWILVIPLLGLAGGAVVWRRLRTRPSPPQPAQPPPQAPPAPDVRFELEHDPGRQSLDTGGQPLRPDIDIRFKLRLEESTQLVEDDDITLTGS
jgi:hypothetical protein